VTVFEPLLRLDVRHDYLGHVVPAITLEPDAATVELAARPELRLRLADGSAQLYAARDRTALALLADDGALALTFRLRPRDPALFAMTAAVADARDRIAVLDPGPLPSGALHGGDTVTENDLRPLIADRPVTPADVARPPLALVRITVDPQAQDAAYHLRFAAVERFWTYHLIGGAADASYHIRDRSNALEFEALGPRTMSNGAQAQSFRSSTPIAERARPTGRFELVAEGPFGPRVILPVLPCPRPGPGFVDPDGPRAGSEIYVNLS
jgi:hypothetical protein